VFGCRIGVCVAQTSCYLYTRTADHSHHSTNHPLNIIRHKWRKVILYLLALVLITLFARFFTVSAVYEIAPIKTARAQELKVSTLTLDNWIIKLEEKESGRTANLKIWDVHSFSFGCLQFKKGTLEEFAKKFGFRQEINEEDLYNCHLQKQVAKRMILSDYSLWRRWYQVSLAIGLPPRK